MARSVMSMRKQPGVTIAIWAVCLIGSAMPAFSEPAQAPRLGTVMTPAEVAKWDLSIFPDGRGLPPGKGTAVVGRPLFETHCERCHGPQGRGATAEELVGEPRPPSADNPSKAIGSYWPFATTIFDFVRRSMPAHAPGSLSADEVYAVTAYLLHLNGLIAESDVIDAATLAKVKMPNRDGFTWIDVKKAP